MTSGTAIATSVMTQPIHNSRCLGNGEGGIRTHEAG
jgi:hypothetical protein